MPENPRIVFQIETTVSLVAFIATPEHTLAGWAGTGTCGSDQGGGEKKGPPFYGATKSRAARAGTAGVPATEDERTAQEDQGGQKEDTRTSPA